MSATKQVETALAALGIPLSAVRVSFMEPPAPAVAMTGQTSLREAVSNGVLEAGYQVKAKLAGNCTLGVVTQRAGIAGIITAGHCTENTTPWDGG